MIDLGTVKPGSTIRIPFSSFDKDDGSSITMTNYAAADILIYKDGGTTERASTAGFTATTDFDAKTGKHLAVIDLADNTTAGFYNAGSEYLVAIDAVTVDAVTTGGWIARFKIGYPDATLDTTIATLSSQTSFTLTAGPAEDSALLGCVVLIHDIASAVQHGYGVVSAYTGSTKTVTLTAGVTFTAAAGDNISIFPPGNTRWFNALLTVALPLTPTTAGRTLDVSAGGEAGLDWANIGSPTTAVNLSATNIDVDQVVASVSGAVGSVTGAVGSVTGNVGGNVNGSVASVTTVSAGAISEGSFATTAGSFAPLRIVDQGTAQSATGTTLVLRAAAAFADDEIVGAVLVITGGSAGVGQARTITDYVATTDTATVDAWTTTPTGTITYKIFANAAGASGALTAADVWTYATRVLTAGTNIALAKGSGVTGFNDLDAAGVRSAVGLATANLDTQLDALPTNAELATALGTADDAVLAAIAGLNNLSQANVRTAIGLATANLDTQLDALPTNAELATALGTADDAVLAAIAALNNLSAAQVNAEVVDALATDTYAEPGQGTPAATTSLSAKIGYLYKAWRNRSTQTATQYSLYNDDATTVAQKATFSDDATTADRGEVATGP